MYPSNLTEVVKSNYSSLMFICGNELATMANDNYAQIWTTLKKEAVLRKIIQSVTQNLPTEQNKNKPRDVVKENELTYYKDLRAGKGAVSQPIQAPMIEKTMKHARFFINVLLYLSSVVTQDGSDTSLLARMENYVSTKTVKELATGFRDYDISTNPLIKELANTLSDSVSRNAKYFSNIYGEVVREVCKYIDDPTCASLPDDVDVKDATMLQVLSSPASTVTMSKEHGYEFQIKTDDKTGNTIINFLATEDGNKDDETKKDFDDLRKLAVEMGLYEEAPAESQTEEEAPAESQPDEEVVPVQKNKWSVRLNLKTNGIQLIRKNASLKENSAFAKFKISGIKLIS